MGQVILTLCHAHVYMGQAVLTSHLWVTYTHPCGLGYNDIALMGYLFIIYHNQLCMLIQVYLCVYIGVFVWMDGTAGTLQYGSMDWSQNTHTHDCVAMDVTTDNTTATIKSCDEQAGFVCKRRKIALF